MVSIDICIHRWDRKTQEHARAFGLAYISHNFYGLVRDTFIYYLVIYYNYCFILKNNKRHIT